LAGFLQEFEKQIIVLNQEGQPTKTTAGDEVEIVGTVVSVKTGGHEENCRGGVRNLVVTSELLRPTFHCPPFRKNRERVGQPA